MSRIPVVIGGCAYHLNVRCEHAASLATLATMLAYDDVARDDSGPPSFEIVNVDYQHTSNLPQGRCDWLRRAIALGKGIAISIDSDTSFNASDLLPELALAVDSTVAISCAPVRVGGTSLVNLNVRDNDAGEGRCSVDELSRVLASKHRDIASGGFGLAIFNIEWFARHWREPTPDGITHGVGEDVAMCRAARKRGGRVIALRVRTQHHEFRP